MEIEQLEVFKYLMDCLPLSLLPKQEVEIVAASIEIKYFKRGRRILEPGQTNDFLYLIKSGAVKRYESDGTLAAKFGEKDFFGHASLKRGGSIERVVEAIEDTLLYAIPGTLFFALYEDYEDFRNYFTANVNVHYNKKDLLSGPRTNLAQIEAGALLSHQHSRVDHKISVQECARIMRDRGETALLITQNDEVKGIVTDRAFCTKVVAENLANATPVGVVMSDQLITIDCKSPASEALLIMAKHNIRHLPVVDGNDIIGVLTATDLIHRQSNNPIYLVNQIYKAPDVETLKSYADHLEHTLCQLVQNGLKAHEITFTISTIGRAIMQRLIKLAKQTLGPAPIPYAWLVAGSMARNDQTAKSDQDNGLILSDQYKPELHGEYFREMAKLVCDGLNACGYVYCPGDVMATNDKWRQPLSVWQQYFEDWILTPEKKALMFASIFFDMQVIEGDKALLEQTYAKARTWIKQSPMFLNHLAANALSFTPPLGLFRNFVLEKHGKEEKSLNLKKRGVTPITDLARVYALAAEIHAINTEERLQSAYQARELSEEGFKDLTDAFEFLSLIRIQNQARQIASRNQPDNYLNPGVLSSLERRHLKDTFEIIRRYQQALANRYQTASIG